MEEEIDMMREEEVEVELEDIDPSVLFKEIASLIQKYKRLIVDLKATREEVFAKRDLLNESGIVMDVTLAPIDIEEVVVASVTPGPSVTRGPESVGEVSEKVDDRSTSEIIQDSKDASLTDPNFTPATIQNNMARAINVGMANADKAAAGNILGDFNV